MNIGNVLIKGYASLAPMAGVADRAMREICVKHGASYTVGELVSAKGLVLGDKKSKEFLFNPQGAVPSGIQLFGCEPDIMAEAAKIVCEAHPDFIDINMGCPAPKVSGNGGGSALMRNPVTAAEIVKEVVKAVNVPVTVKMRTGWDKENINAIELAKRCEDAGASLITVHGRTKAQMYSPGIDFETIKNVVNAVKIPVVANGDIKDGKSAFGMYEKTGCALVMVGRAAEGNPFVFKEINAFFNHEVYTPPTLEEKFETLLRQVKMMIEYKGEHIAMLESRKHTAWYMQGLNGAASLRRMCGEIMTLKDINIICEKALEQNRGL